MNEKDYYYYLGNEESKIKMLIIGNSITLHESVPSIGWMNECGMAASNYKLDYVHQLYDLLLKDKKDVYIKVKKCVFWELDLHNNEILDYFKSERDFNPDFIIFRLGENVDVKDEPYFRQATLDLLDYLSRGKNKIILTSCFWPSGRDKILFDISKEFGYQYAVITGNDSDKALNEFKNESVRLHPGDKGMKMIANKIYDVLKKEL